MAIDDPLDASAERVAAEERTDSPLTRFALPLAELSQIIPSSLLPTPLSAIAELAKSGITAAGLYVSRVQANRRQYLIDFLGKEVRRIRASLEELEMDHKRFVQEEFIPLVLDGLQKAEQTRSEARIRRIAAILAHALEVGPVQTSDTTEEMMRIAMALSDDDVLVLRSLYQDQKPYYNSASGKTGHEQANDFWRLIDPTRGLNTTPALACLRTFPAGVLQGICAKLQSFGLLAQFERNQSKLDPGVIPFGILAKTVVFVEYIRDN